MAALDAQVAMKHVVLVGLVCSLMLASSNSWGCSCGTTKQGAERVKESFANSDAVFLGRVDEIVLADDLSGAKVQTTTFRIVKSWKGQREGLIKTKINIQCCVCGYRFEQDYEYLVFAYRKKDSGWLSASICSSTTSRDAADDDIETLERLVEEGI